MSSVPYFIRRNGVLNLPRSSPASKALTETLLQNDAQQNHCYFKQSGLHNHLIHHILAAYDLGTPAGLLQKIFESENSYQRPIENWSDFLENQSAYGAFVTFFESRVSSFGALKTIEEFIFSPAANEQGKLMLARLMSGALHPFILLGYALEFGNDALVSTGISSSNLSKTLLSTYIFHFTGIASACVHTVRSSCLFEPEPKNNSTGLTVLEILSLLQASPILKPEEIIALCSRFHVDETLGDAEMKSKIEELVWGSVLLLFATGREGRKPRLDFFLMHLVTSSIFLQSYINVLENPAHKASIIKAFLPGMLLFSLVRGRPTIKPHLLMEATDKPRPPYLSATDKPRPPYLSGSPYKPGKNTIGSPMNDEDYNPWPALIEASIHSSDSHVPQDDADIVRGYTSGSVIGAFKQAEGAKEAETHEGVAKLDGSIFVRAAGMLMDYMGWTTYGQPERDDWDRSAHGWDDAWNDGD
ncbi:hypothetical protein BT96DRAFT_956686 [Gymnopus androsaceus JB14]|uniref:Uncharacterized protein n=1 Tax=Gymnopus androsaceus JB14 TaxID=1447944 RepID=A0A6A4HS99_9AGAR|nr:hypothetical protein BT96DRAFT_956686 [Gymnopus androsaceus JB14]